jgi:hypothetical protein
MPPAAGAGREPRGAVLSSRPACLTCKVAGLPQAAAPRLSSKTASPPQQREGRV